MPDAPPAQLCLPSESLAKITRENQSVMKFEFFSASGARADPTPYPIIGSRHNDMSAQPSRKRDKAGGSRSNESGRKKPRKNPASRRLSAEEADELGSVSVAALRERIPKQRYDAALAAGPHALTLP